MLRVAEGVREPEAFRKASEWDESGWPKIWICIGRFSR